MSGAMVPKTLRSTVVNVNVPGISLPLVMVQVANVRLIRRSDTSVVTVVPENVSLKIDADGVGEGAGVSSLLPATSVATTVPPAMAPPTTTTVVAVTPPPAAAPPAAPTAVAVPAAPPAAPTPVPVPADPPAAADPACARVTTFVWRSRQ